VVFQVGIQRRDFNVVCVPIRVYMYDVKLIICGELRRCARKKASGGQVCKLCFLLLWTCSPISFKKAMHVLVFSTYVTDHLVGTRFHGCSFPIVNGRGVASFVVCVSCGCFLTCGAIGMSGRVSCGHLLITRPIRLKRIQWRTIKAPGPKPRIRSRPPLSWLAAQGPNPGFSMPGEAPFWPAKGRGAVNALFLSKWRGAIRLFGVFIRRNTGVVPTRPT